MPRVSINKLINSNKEGKSIMIHERSHIESIERHAKISQLEKKNPAYFKQIFQIQ